MSSSSNSVCGIVEKLLKYLQPHWFFLTTDFENIAEPVVGCEKVTADAVFQQLNSVL